MHRAMSRMWISGMLQVITGTVGRTDDRPGKSGMRHGTRAEASDQGLQRHQNADQRGQWAAAKSVSDQLPKKAHG